MPEMTVSTTELKELIQDAMRAQNEKITGQFNVIDCKLDLITQRLDRLNGKVAEHEKIINERSVVVSDYICHAKEAVETEKRIRVLEDQQLSNRTMKRLIVTSIGLTGSLIAIGFTLFQFFVMK
ncbi:MAG TPA: hypothetical protein VK179_19590 [Bacteroidales bacterium]|nr:hypothetical protein [Bacteroidales bacterium]